MDKNAFRKIGNAIFRRIASMEVTNRQIVRNSLVNPNNLLVLKAKNAYL